MPGVGTAPGQVGASSRLAIAALALAGALAGGGAVFQLLHGLKEEAQTNADAFEYPCTGDCLDDPPRAYLDHGPSAFVNYGDAGSHRRGYDVENPLDGE
jgi:hypothetical protein